MKKVMHKKAGDRGNTYRRRLWLATCDKKGAKTVWQELHS